MSRTFSIDELIVGEKVKLLEDGELSDEAFLLGIDRNNPMGIIVRLESIMFEAGMESDFLIIDAATCSCQLIIEGAYDEKCTSARGAVYTLEPTQ